MSATERSSGVPDDGDLRPDADLFGGFGAKPLPDRAEPKPRAEPVRSEPKRRNSSDSDVESEAAEASPAEEEHNKQGLELAKSLAGRLKGMSPVKPVKKTRRRRPGGAQVSSARPDDRDPQLLTNTLGRLMREQGWEVDVAVHGVMSRWPSIVGPEMASHCTPESYQDTELTVRTDSTAWATQVRLLAPDLVRRLNAELGDGTVTRVKVEGPNAPSWRKGPRTVRGGRGPRDTYG
jgi:predicted nucleic acid-binding Zn ribbon protein